MRRDGGEESVAGEGEVGEGNGVDELVVDHRSHVVDEAPVEDR